MAAGISAAFPEPDCGRKIPVTAGNPADKIARSETVLHASELLLIIP
jgi:hypothetical protein